MSLESFFTPQIKTLFEFLVFFLVAPELLGENVLRKIRKLLIIFLFWVSILLLVVVILLFLYSLAVMPFWIGNSAVLVAAYLYNSFEGTIIFDSEDVRVVAYVISPLILLALSYLPTLISNLLAILAEKENTRRFLIKAGVLLFIVSKMLEFVITFFQKTG